MRTWITLALSLTLFARIASADVDLLSTATASLKANIETVGDVRYMTAGRHQFRSLWSRDFCYSSRALLEIGEASVVRDQLSLYLKFRRDTDALIPRTLDSIPAQMRVVRQVFSRFLGEPNIPIRPDLKAEYLSENGTAAIDSNILIILTALSYVEATQDFDWWKANESALVEVFRYYDKHKDGPLITQPPYSDWQDSVRRDGKAFLTNLIYWAVLKELVGFPSFAVTQDQVDSVRDAIDATFYDSSTGLYRTMDSGPQVSLEGILLAIDLGFVQGDDATSLFESLQKYPLWTGKPGGPGVPGFVTYPDYPASQISWTSRFVGLGHYHDEIYWSWLLGLSLKTAHRFGDNEAESNLLDALERVTTRDGAVAEIFFPDQELTLWSSSWLTAEKPFSWGSAFIIDALVSPDRPELIPNED
jgi:glycogen debranching enzyme